MKENRVVKINNDDTDIVNLNKLLDEGWLIQNVTPAGSGTIFYVLVREISDDEKEDAERMSITRQLHIALEELGKECRRKHFLWRFIKEAYERSKANDNKWWANVSCYFNVSKFPEIFETYDVGSAIEIIQKYYNEEDEDDKKQSSEN